MNTRFAQAVYPYSRRKTRILECMKQLHGQYRRRFRRYTPNDIPCVQRHPGDDCPRRKVLPNAHPQSPERTQTDNGRNHGHRARHDESNPENGIHYLWSGGCLCVEGILDRKHNMKGKERSTARPDLCSFCRRQGNTCNVEERHCSPKSLTGVVPRQIYEGNQLHRRHHPHRSEARNGHSQLRSSYPRKQATG